MVGLLFKEATAPNEEDQWADAVDWEACKAEEVQPEKAFSIEGWEVVH